MHTILLESAGIIHFPGTNRTPQPPDSVLPALAQGGSRENWQRVGVGAGADESLIGWASLGKPLALSGPYILQLEN